jgi:hypothetical protein
MMLLAHFFLSRHNIPTGPRPPHCRGFIITLTHTKLGRTRLEEWSALRRDIYLTTHNNHKKRTSMPPPGGTRTHKPSKRAAAGHRLRLCGHWDWIRRHYNIHGLILFKHFLFIFVHYTECPRKNVPNFGRVFLMLKYTDVTQNTYCQSWTMAEKMAREVWNFDSCYTLIYYKHILKLAGRCGFCNVNICT